MPHELMRQAGQRKIFAAEHIVQPGETLQEIAERYDVNSVTLAASNRLLEQPIFGIGEVLRVPSTSGLPHIVQAGETLDELAARYDVSLATIVGYGPNQIIAGDPLPAGTELFIPGATPAGVDEDALGAQVAVPIGLVRDDETNMRTGPGTRYEKVGQLSGGTPVQLLAKHERWIKVQQLGGDSAWMSETVLSAPAEATAVLPETDDFPPPPPIWVWPTTGALTSGFGWRNYPWGMFHNGFDIANDYGTPIYAARDGRVIEAGWCSGYGYCVKIQHDGGFRTEYGHMLQQPDVLTGDVVAAGDFIGYMGSTYDLAGGGYSTGSHLHFSIFQDGVAVNPGNYLP